MPIGDIDDEYVAALLDKLFGAFEVVLIGTHSSANIQFAIQSLVSQFELLILEYVLEADQPLNLTPGIHQRDLLNLTANGHILGRFDQFLDIVGLFVEVIGYLDHLEMVDRSHIFLDELVVVLELHDIPVCEDALQHHLLLADFESGGVALPGCLADQKRPNIME